MSVGVDRVQSHSAASGITSRQLFILFVAYLGWVFDLMDVFLMVLVKERAMAELLGPGAPQKAIGVWGGWALGITLVGWSIGGLLFGMVADRWGRTRTMALTILIYSVFTGLTGLAQTPGQLLVLRFIAALGIGGEWGAGASMIAEVFPKASRAWAAGILQSAAGTGFFAAILLEYLVGGNWRYAFFAGLFTSGIYSGYTIYFPELFPTRVRATGASFCYNVGRIVAAPGPVLMGWLTGALAASVPAGQQVAYAGAIMGWSTCSVSR